MVADFFVRPYSVGLDFHDVTLWQHRRRWKRAFSRAVAEISCFASCTFILLRLLLCVGEDGVKF
jgi:hypothetical protein